MRLDPEVQPQTWQTPEQLKWLSIPRLSERMRSHATMVVTHSHCHSFSRQARLQQQHTSRHSLDMSANLQRTLRHHLQPLNAMASSRGMTRQEANSCLPVAVGRA